MELCKGTASSTTVNTVQNQAAFTQSQEEQAGEQQGVGLYTCSQRFAEKSRCTEWSSTSFFFSK